MAAEAAAARPEWPSHRRNGSIERPSHRRHRGHQRDVEHQQEKQEKQQQRKNQLEKQQGLCENQQQQKKQHPEEKQKQPEQKQKQQEDEEQQQRFQQPQDAGFPETHELKVLAGKYIRTKLLGKGAQGTVWECEEVGTGERFACKSFPKRRDGARGFDVEVRALRALAGHENVVRLVDVVRCSKEVHVILELVTGGDLLSRVLHDGPLHEAEAAQLFRQLVEALAACHARGIVHRDVKPDNVLIKPVPLEETLPSASPACSRCASRLAQERSLGNIRAVDQAWPRYGGKARLGEDEASSPMTPREAQCSTSSRASRPPSLDRTEKTAPPEEGRKNRHCHFLYPTRDTSGRTTPSFRKLRSFLPLLMGGGTINSSSNAGAGDACNSSSGSSSSSRSGSSSRSSSSGSNSSDYISGTSSPLSPRTFRSAFGRRATDEQRTSAAANGSSGDSSSKAATAQCSCKRRSSSSLQGLSVSMRVVQQVKLVDFALSDTADAIAAEFEWGREQRQQQQESKQAAWKLVGTKQYMAPEVQDGPCTFQSDVYSLGITLFAMLTGRLPALDDKTGSALAVDFSSACVRRLSPSVVDLLRGMLAAVPEERLTAMQVIEHHWVVGHHKQWLKEMRHDQRRRGSLGMLPWTAWE